MICQTDNAAGEVYPILPPNVENRKFSMKLPALVRFSQQDVYMLLTILGCTVNCRFRFADCPLIHCAIEKCFPPVMLRFCVNVFKMEGACIR